MPVTVNLQGNPNALGNPWAGDIGTRNADAVIISSGSSSGNVTYEIRRQDRTSWTMNNQSVLSVSSTQGTSELIRALSASSLTIVLPFRQWFEARARRGSGSWTSWVAFKTRDKTYTLPDAITENRITTAASSTGQTVTVTNVGKATETTSSTGSRVVNTDYGDNDVTNVITTSRGQTVTRQTTETATSTGVQITTS